MKVIRPHRIIAAALVGALALAAPVPLHCQDAPSTDKVREEQAYTLGTAAYLWGFTMNELYRVRSVHLAKPGNTVNRFDHLRVLMTPELARKVGVVRANSATLYSAAWLDLSVEPIILEFPAIADRYFTFNYVDYFQHNENISNVTVGRKGGAYAFVGPTGRALFPTTSIASMSRLTPSGSSGAPRSKGRTTSKTSTRFRTATASRRCANGWKAAATLSGQNAYPQWPAYEASNPLNFFALLNEGLKHNPPQGVDLVTLGLFETLNIGPNKIFDPAKLDTATAAGLKRALEIGPQILTADFKARVGKLINGWQITTELGSWQTPDTDQVDFVRRSAIAKEAQPGQHSSEAMFPFTFSDSDGQPLTGTNRYVLRFAKGKLPPVNAFWSVTLYDAEGFVIENPILRYQIGTYDNLKLDPDGSTAIYIQRDSPGKDKGGNWLPAPDGPFNLTMRLYNPRPEAITLDWTPPPVERLK